jgi:hypothetical protein
MKQSIHELYRVVQKEVYKVGFEVLTAVGTKIAVFWVVAPCSLVEVNQRFRVPCCLHHQGDEYSSRASETLVHFYQTTRRYNPEDSHLQEVYTFKNLFYKSNDAKSMSCVRTERKSLKVLISMI